MRFLFLIGVLITVFSSCRTQRPITNNYLLNVSDTTIRDSVAFQKPVIRKGDILSIRVYSLANGIDPRADAPFNLVETGGAGAQGASGFIVSDEGKIEYPQIGELYVEGMTREQLEAEIKKRLAGLLSQPSVIVRFLNFRFTVLGEVGNPGTFTSANEKISILEALGIAGDITEFGQKNNVKIVRENNGQREIGSLDLTSKDMFTSPFFRLQQNDVVLVEQTGRKRKQQDRQELVQQIGIATSIITAIALVLNLIR